MLYLVAVAFPPLAVLLCGKPFQAILSIPLTLLGWAPGVSTNQGLELFFQSCRERKRNA